MEWEAKGNTHPRYSAKTLSAISARDEGVPDTYVYGVHGGVRGKTPVRQQVLGSDSESDFETSSSGTLNDREFKQALGSFWDHVALEAEEEEKARANKANGTCACPVTYHTPRGADVKLESPPPKVAEAPGRRRSVSTRNSYLSPHQSPHSSLTRFASPSPISTSRHSFSRGGGSYHHHHHHQYHHSLSSRPVVMQSPHQRHRSWSISESCIQRHRAQSEDVLLNSAFLAPLSARHLRSSSFQQLQRHQTLPSQRSPPALHALARPKSRSDVLSLSISPSPVLRARSFDPTSAQLPLSQRKIPTQSHPKKLPDRSPDRINSPVRNSPLKPRDSSLSPRRPRHASGSISPQRQTPRKQTPQLHSSPPKSAHGHGSPQKQRPDPVTPTRLRGSPLKSNPNFSRSSPQKDFSPQKPSSQKSSPQKLSPQKQSPSKTESYQKVSPSKPHSPYTSNLPPVSLHGPLRSATLQSQHVPHRAQLPLQQSSISRGETPTSTLSHLPSSSPQKIPVATEAALVALKEAHDSRPPSRSFMRKTQSGPPTSTGILPPTSTGILPPGAEQPKKVPWYRSLGKHKDKQKPPPEAKVNVLAPLWRRLAARATQKTLRSDVSNTSGPLTSQPSSFFSNAVH